MSYSRIQTKVRRAVACMFRFTELAHSFLSVMLYFDIRKRMPNVYTLK
jgi:hypothetical protein